jgi:hypothetical protein
MLPCVDLLDKVPDPIPACVEIPILRFHMFEFLLLHPVGLNSDPLLHDSLQGSSFDGGVDLSDCSIHCGVPLCVITSVGARLEWRARGTFQLFSIVEHSLGCLPQIRGQGQFLHFILYPQWLWSFSCAEYVLG